MIPSRQPTWIVTVTRVSWVGALVASVAVVGCAGDGSRIPGPVTGGGTTLATLQTDVFTPWCSACHQPGGIGPMPLDNEAATFANLVGVDSIEIATLKRVEPFDSENSYLVWKIENRPNIVGGAMPLGGPLLTQDQIDAIREWIDDGALP